MMATQEVGTMAKKSTTKATKDDTDRDDLDMTIPKISHNNPEEAAQFLRWVNTLANTFVDNLSGFNRYALLDNYKTFIHDLHQALITLDSTYFGDANPKLVLDLIDDKICKAYCKRPRDDEAPIIEVRKATDTIP